MDSSFCVARRLVLGLVVGSLGLGLFGCGGDNSTATGVGVVNPRLVKAPDGQRSFTGTLVNERARSLSIAQVEVVLYDDKGSVVETVRIEVKDVPAQDSVDFSEPIDSDRAFRQAQVKSVLTP
jgi:hypothetical protein